MVALIFSPTVRNPMGFNRHKSDLILSEEERKEGHITALALLRIRAKISSMSAGRCGIAPTRNCTHIFKM